jgi:serine protease Do
MSKNALLFAVLSASLLAPACARPNETTAKPAAPPTPSASATAAYSVLPSPALARVGPNGSAANIADVVEKVLPSIVSVWSTKVASVERDPFGRRPDNFPRSGLGSGVVIAPGTVLTNYHVVSDADQLKVGTADKHELDADVIGKDPKSDLAVLKVRGDTSKLKPLPLGTSSRLRLGDVVLAIGNPFGLGQTVTMGIVSAKGRANVGIVDYEDFIQTDAAINPGNSGGALVDMEGNLVGINTAILSRTGGNVGIGFAIPTDMAKPIVDSLVKGGRVVRGWLGVSIQDVDQDLASALKLPNVNGVVVSDVQSDGPAFKAGLHRRDVILSIDGKAVESTGQFRNTIASMGSGKSVKLGLLREGKKQDLSVALAEVPTDLRRVAWSDEKSASSLDGLTLESLSPSLRNRFDIGSEVRSGVVVTDVQSGSPAARTGLRLGDVILEVNREKVASVASVKQQLQKSGKRTLLLVYREGTTVFVVVRR